MLHGVESGGNLDIWVSYCASGHDAWAVPGRLPALVNSDRDDFCPTPLTGGRLLFVSARESACGPVGNANIYETRLDPVLGWLPPQILPCGDVDGVNSAAPEFSPSLVEAEGRTILFFSSGRSGTPDIWTARRSKISKPWSEPVKLGENVNSDAAESRPALSRDGRRLSFGSTRNGGQFDIYVSTRFLPPGPPH